MYSTISTVAELKIKYYKQKSQGPVGHGLPWFKVDDSKAFNSLGQRSEKDRHLRKLTVQKLIAK